MSETALIAVISASAALLGSLLTALASLGVVQLQEHRRARAAERDAFQAAAQLVLSKGLSIIDQAILLSAVVRSESTPLAGLAVLLRLRDPANRLRLMESLLADQEELRFAGAHVVLDFLTFGVLLLAVGANEHQFQTGWFIESLFTQVLVVLVIRTRLSPFWPDSCHFLFPSRWVWLWLGVIPPARAVWGD